MKKSLIILSMMVILTNCTKFDFDGFDPTTATVRWIIKNNDVKRTSVHITPSAIPCTATFEAASPVEVWSLWPRGSTCTESAGFDMNR